MRAVVHIAGRELLPDPAIDYVRGRRPNYQRDYLGSFLMLSYLVDSAAVIGKGQFQILGDTMGREILLP